MEKKEKIKAYIKLCYVGMIGIIIIEVVLACKGIDGKVARYSMSSLVGLAVNTFHLIKKL